MAPRIPVELIARLAGLLLVGLCAGRVIGHVAQTVVAWPWPPWTSQGLLEWMAGAVVIRRCLRDVYGRCAACGYEVAGHAGAVCPECGAMLPGRSAARAAGEAAPVERVG